MPPGIPPPPPCIPSRPAAGASVAGAASGRQTQTAQNNPVPVGYPTKLKIKLTSQDVVSFSTGASPLNVAFSQSSNTTGKRPAQGHAHATGQTQGLHPEEHPAIACDAPEKPNPFLDRTVEHLKEALASGGLVQFVSPAAFHGHQSRDLSIGRYLSMRRSADPSLPVYIDGLGHVHIQEHAVQTQQGPQYPHRVYHLSVTNDQQKTETIKIVEIGFSYRDNCFTSDELEKVHQIVRKQFQPGAASTSTSQPHAVKPHIASFSGFGRNAALIAMLSVHRELQKDPEQDVEVLLRDIVEQARTSNRDFLKTVSKSNPQTTQYQEVLNYLTQYQSQLLQRTSQAQPRGAQTPRPASRLSSSAGQPQPGQLPNSNPPSVLDDAGSDTEEGISTPKTEDYFSMDEDDVTATPGAAPAVTPKKLPIIDGGTSLEKAVLQIVLGDTAFGNKLTSELPRHRQPSSQPATANGQNSAHDTLIGLLDRQMQNPEQSINVDQLIQEINQSAAHNQSEPPQPIAETPGQFLRRLIQAQPANIKKTFSDLTPVFNESQFVPMEANSLNLREVTIEELMISQCQKFGSEPTVRTRKKDNTGAYTDTTAAPGNGLPFIFDISTYPYQIKQGSASTSTILDETFHDAENDHSKYHIDSLVTQPDPRRRPDHFVTYVRSPAKRTLWIRHSTTTSSPGETLAEKYVEEKLKREKIHLIGFAAGPRPVEAAGGDESTQRQDSFLKKVRSQLFDRSQSSKTT